jgi:hypothetical protein
MAYTDIWDVTTPLDTQAANQGAVDFRATKLDVMQRIASFGAGLLAARPTPETTGATADWTGVMYWATDTKQVFRWSGAAWVDISASIPNGTSSNFSDVTQATTTNPAVTVALNTIAVPGTFTTKNVVRSRVSGLVTFSAGTPSVQIKVNGTSLFIFSAFTTNDQYLIELELLAINATHLIATLVFYEFVAGVATVVKIGATASIAFTAGVSFDVVFNSVNAFTGTVTTQGMSGFMV